MSVEARLPRREEGESDGGAKGEGKRRKTVEGENSVAFLVRTRTRAHSNCNVVFFAVTSVTRRRKNGE